jgi:hypothetical protein
MQEKGGGGADGLRGLKANGGESEGHKVIEGEGGDRIEGDRVTGRQGKGAGCNSLLINRFPNIILHRSPNSPKLFLSPTPFLSISLIPHLLPTPACSSRIKFNGPTSLRGRGNAGRFSGIEWWARAGTESMAAAFQCMSGARVHASFKNSKRTFRQHHLKRFQKGKTSGADWMEHRYD